MQPTQGNISDLVDDILVNIICRLTIKQIFTCKCVSKSWLKLISDVLMPNITSAAMHGLIFNTCTIPPRRRKGPWSFTSIDDHHQIANYLDSAGMVLPFHPSPDDFLDCCNGLLLFFNRLNMHYYVCNPATEQYTSVPNPPEDFIPITAALIFDPNYKIVHISGIPPTMYIFSPEIDDWSTHTLNTEASIINSEGTTRYVSLDGSLYRLLICGYLSKFDVRRKCHQAIELPKVVVRKNPIGCIGVSQGRLHYGWDDQMAGMMLWMLRDEIEDSHQWVLKYSIGLHYFNQHPLCINFHSDQLFSVFAFHPTSDKVFVGNHHGIFGYDPRTKRLATICKLSEDKGIFSAQYLVYPFSINLTSLEDDAGTRKK